MLRPGRRARVAPLKPGKKNGKCYRKSDGVQITQSFRDVQWEFSFYHNHREQGIVKDIVQSV